MIDYINNIVLYNHLATSEIHLMKQYHRFDLLNNDSLVDNHLLQFHLHHQLLHKVWDLCHFF